MPPLISSRGGTVTVVVNEAARLDCEATGLPPPSLTWLKDGRPVASVSDGIQARPMMHHPAHTHTNTHTDKTTICFLI